MKKFNEHQQIVFNHLKSRVVESNLATELFEITEAYESVEDDVLDAYEKLSHKEFNEVIYKISELLILNK